MGGLEDMEKPGKWKRTLVVLESVGIALSYIAMLAFFLYPVVGVSSA